MTTKNWLATMIWVCGINNVSKKGGKGRERSQTGLI